MDDDQDILDGFKAILEYEGFSIESAPSPGEALKKVKERRFRLAILDYMLPNMKGDELAKELQEIDSSIMLIVMSGYKDALDSLNSRGVRIEKFFLKPIDPESLINAVRTAIAKNSTHHEVMDTQDVFTMQQVV
ncbi:response regulator [Candidatus Bathyarchaeota archaeon]|nr:response regulator [Candidatus Bathyarchaeota archaeon]